MEHSGETKGAPLCWFLSAFDVYQTLIANVYIFAYQNQYNVPRGPGPTLLQSTHIHIQLDHLIRGILYKWTAAKWNEWRSRHPPSHGKSVATQ